MALTENVMTAEEFDAALTANPELIKVVEPVLTKREYTVLDKERKSAYDNSKEVEISQNLTKKIAGRVETEIKEITGVERKEGEKWYDYNKRAAKVLKDKSSDLENELTPLRGKSDISAAERDRINNQQELIKSMKTANDTMKTTYEQQIVQMKAGNKILSEVTPLMAKFNPVIPAMATNMMHEQVVSKMSANAIYDESLGRLIHKGVDGKPLMKDGNYMTSQEIYTEQMKDFLDLGKQQTGVGGEEGGPNDGSLPLGITNQQLLSDWLIKNGKVAGSKEYNDLWAKHAPKLPRR